MNRMTVSISLIRKSDLDLITLYLKGIPIEKIFKMALLNRVCGNPFSVAVEPVPPISLGEARTSRYDKNSGCSRPVSFRLQIKISDPDCIMYMNSARHSFMSAMAKNMIRSAIVNMPLSYLMATPEDLEKKRALANGNTSLAESRKYYTDETMIPISALIRREIEKERAAFEKILESDRDIYIARSDGTLLPRSSGPEVKKDAEKKKTVKKEAENKPRRITTELPHSDSVDEEARNLLYEEAPEADFDTAFNFGPDSDLNGNIRKL